MKKRLTALLCALALLWVFVLPQAAGASTTVYLLATNDKMCDLPGGYLPVAMDGTIYVPYTVFDKESTGVDLGVYYGLKQDRGTVLNLYSLNGMLTFTVSMGTCEDNQGNLMDFHAINRGNPLIPYVPAAAVCRYFGLQYSFLPTTDRGTLIRITSSPNCMSDSMFLDSAVTGMTYRYNEILRSQEAQPTPSPAATVPPVSSATPAPSGSKSHVRVYLAVDASQTEEDLTALFPAGTHVLFLFTPDSLTLRSAQVRQAVAAGHSVGLLVDGTLGQVTQQLERGNDLLAHIARTRTRIVAAPSALTSALTERGWACWQTNVSGTTSAAILGALELKQSVGRVTLPPSAAVVSRVITQLREDGYSLRQPLETDL